MPKYSCENCTKEFKLKSELTKHKKTCNNQEKKISDKDDMRSLSLLFSNCMNILRDNEGLTGEKALRNFSYLLVLKFIEPMIGKEIDFESFDYELGPYEVNGKSKIIENIRFTKLANSDMLELNHRLEIVWDCILSQHPKTKDIFEYTKKFDIKKSTTFKKLIDKLYNFDFSNMNIDIQGSSYEELLKDIMTGKVLGQFFTQPLIKDFMIELINPRLNKNGTCETIFDPAMGTGGFLISSISHMKKQSIKENIDIDWKFMTSKGIGGRELEPDTFQLAKANMLISSGHLFSTLERGDSIRKSIKNKYDIVLANPPFGIKGLNYSEIRDDDRDEYMPIESKNAVSLFIQVIISILNIGGRCAVVVPSGQDLFGKNKTLVAVREYLMKTCDLKEVINLPSGIFTSTSIKTSILYFYKKKEGNEVIEIGGNKIRTYKFIHEHETSIVQFYDYDPYKKNKKLIAEAEIETIREKKYSLNYNDYIIKERKEIDRSIEWKTLGEICEIEQGKFLTKTSINEGNISVIGGGKIIGTHNEFNRKNDCTVITRVGDININYMNAPFYLTDNGFSIYSENIITNKYIYYYLSNIKNALNELYSGSAQKVISKTNLKEIPIPIPSLEYQEKIVEDIDLIYETNIQNKKSIEGLKKKQKILISRYTKDCKTQLLSEICEINPDSLQKDEYSYINYIDISSVEKGVINQVKKLTSDFPSRAKRKIKIGDTIYSMVRPNLENYAYYEKQIDNCVVSTGFIVLRPININKRYFFYIISQKHISEYLSKNATGSQYPSVTVDNFNNIPIPIPSNSIQEKIVKECERIDKLIQDLEYEIESSQNLCKSIIDDLSKENNEVESNEIEYIFEDENGSIIEQE